MADKSVVSSLEDSREGRVTDLELNFGNDSNSVDAFTAATPLVAWEFVTWAFENFFYTFSKHSSRASPISCAMI